MLDVHTDVQTFAPCGLSAGCLSAGRVQVSTHRSWCAFVCVNVSCSRRYSTVAIYTNTFSCISYTRRRTSSCRSPRWTLYYY